VPGNDDSALCVNFYCYLLSRAILVGKLDAILTHDKFFPYRPYRTARFQQKEVDFVYLYSNVFRNYEKKRFFDIFENTRKHIVPIKGSVGHYINY
jgi:ribosomal protein S2